MYQLQVEDLDEWCWNVQTWTKVQRTMLYRYIVIQSKWGTFGLQLSCI